MGHSKAGEIAEGLIKAGMDPETPASVLARAYMADEKRVDGTLGNLGDIAREVQAPAVIVIGKTASMHLEPAEEKATPEVYCAEESRRKSDPRGILRTRRRLRATHSSHCRHPLLHTESSGGPQRGWD